MSYSRTKLAEFGPLDSGLSTVAYSLDGETWITSGVTEIAAGSGSYKASVTFPDGFRGVLQWRTAEVDGRLAFEEINPEDAEIPAQVWTNSNRTVTAFGFTVAATLSGTPAFRNQDGIAAPTYDDCLAAAWANANAKELESDTDLTFIRYLPNGQPMRTFILTADARGNPIGRE